MRILVQWGPGGGPRNVLIEREDGSTVVRPFRGLRRLPAPPVPSMEPLFQTDVMVPERPVLGGLNRSGVSLPIRKKA